MAEKSSPPPPPIAQQPLMDQDLLIHDQTQTHHSR